MRDEKLIVALPGMLPHNKKLHGFQLYFIFYESTRSPLIFCCPLSLESLPYNTQLPHCSYCFFPKPPPTISHNFAPSSNSCTQSPSTPPFKNVSILTTTMPRQQCPLLRVSCSPLTYRGRPPLTNMMSFANIFSKCNMCSPKLHHLAKEKGSRKKKKKKKIYPPNRGLQVTLSFDSS